MYQTINIVKLIEENPNTKLSNSYQGKLINKLKDNFSIEMSMWSFNLKKGFKKT